MHTVDPNARRNEEEAAPGGTQLQWELVISSREMDVQGEAAARGLAQNGAMERDRYRRIGGDAAGETNSITQREKVSYLS
jgi:hypothetical protein